MPKVPDRLDTDLCVFMMTFSALTVALLTFVYFELPFESTGYVEVSALENLHTN